MMSKIAQPHDNIFRRSMQEKKIATDLMRSKLPPELLVEMDFSTLELANGDFVEKDLQRFQSDVIYRCKIRGSDGYIVIAAEHQSSADQMMAYRMLQYVVAAMGSHLRQGHDKLPIVIPLVVYHGKQSPYPYSTEIWDCFKHPELAKKWALKPLRLLDLTVLTDDEIDHHGLAFAMETVLKHSREQRLAWLLSMLANTKMAIILSEVGDNYVHDLLLYVLHACEGNQPPEELGKLIDLLADANPDKKERFVTIAQQLQDKGRQEGMQQGMQEGMQQGRQENSQQIAKLMLADGFDREMVKRYTGLSDADLPSLH